MEDQPPRVWRTYSHTENSGYFVWEVLEVIGEPGLNAASIQCRDGSYVYTSCIHSWHKKAAQFMLIDVFPNIQELVLLTNTDKQFANGLI